MRTEKKNNHVARMNKSEPNNTENKVNFEFMKIRFFAPSAVSKKHAFQRFQRPTIISAGGFIQKQKVGSTGDHTCSNSITYSQEFNDIAASKFRSHIMDAATEGKGAEKMQS